MARQLLIAGVDRNSELITNTLKIQPLLTDAEDVCFFQLKGDMPANMSEIIIEDGYRRFGGIIDKPVLDKVTPRGVNIWKVNCRDYTFQMNQKLVVETYKNMAADAIAIDIITKYCPGFSVTGIKTGAPVIEEMPFPYMHPSDCMKELCKYIGWEWYVDYYKVVHFFSSFEEPAPMVIEEGAQFYDFTFSPDTQRLKNRIYVHGGRTLSDKSNWYSEVADGKKRIFILPHVPHELSLDIGGTPVPDDRIGIENKDKETEKEYLVNHGDSDKYLRCAASTSTPVNGATLDFFYRFEIKIIAVVEDLPSQQAIAAIQGSDGIYEEVITDETLVTDEAAEAAGDEKLREQANPKVSGNFKTETDGWFPGQLVTINLPKRGIVNQYLIHSVTITPHSPGKYSYRVEYGGRLIGLPDKLKAIVSAQQRKRLNETSVIQKITQSHEKVGIFDEVSFAERSKVFYCGDPDAYCGFIQCSQIE